jgi:hypothetical protein
MQIESYRTRLEDQYLEQLRVSLEMSLGIPFAEVGTRDEAHWEGMTY